MAAAAVTNVDRERHSLLARLKKDEAECARAEDSLRLAEAALPQVSEVSDGAISVGLILCVLCL